MVRVLRACLLMFSASPATAAMEICCVWWTTKEEALADAAPYTVRSVFKKKRACLLLTFLPIT